MPVPVIRSYLASYKTAPALVRGLFFILLCQFLFLSSTAQDYNYIHYDTKDGLAGSTVYDLCQDRDGFMWFATDAGVSRFDGTRFKNFTIADGLPESEILKLFADSYGRVWIAPFKNTICYYYKGVIKTADNDSALKKIRINSSLVNIKEDSEGTLLFLTTDRNVFLLPHPAKNGVDSFIHLPLEPVWGIGSNFGGRSGFMLSIRNNTFLLQKNQMIRLGDIYSGEPDSAIVNMFTDSSYSVAIKPPGHLSADAILTSTYYRVIFMNTVSGSWMLDTLRLDRYSDVFLKGKQVSRAFIDQEKNIWFTTLGEGVYKLVSREFKSWQFKAGQATEVFSLEKYQGKVIAGMGLGWIYSLSRQGIDSANFNHLLPRSITNLLPNRVTCIKKLHNGDLLLGLDGILLRKSRLGYQKSDIRPIKSIEEIDSTTLLVATGYNTLTVRQKDLSVKDTIWPHRTTAACFYNNDYYIGTTNGLYIVKKDRSVVFAGDNVPSLRFRIISFMRQDDGNLWIATNGAGIVRMQGNKVTRNLTVKQGLNSDLCRTLFVKDHFLWVGTDKGLNKVDISDPLLPTTSFSTADGLPSNIINAIYVDSNKVYIGSPAGLTSFDENKVFNSSRCDLRILEVSVSGRIMPLQNAYTFGYKNNNLKVEFVAISFKSGGDILYRYRLKGLKDDWDSTRQNLLEYPSLPSGDYQLEIVAINKFGVKSEMVSVSFLIETPFWQTWWFKLLVIGLAIALTTMIVALRFNVLRKREREKTGLQQKIHNLEQLALRSQMNPHFIFNCLNSIQNFIINKDLETTNQYLTEFANLIRQTLDSADKGVISIKQEIQYLTRYIDLERMRFGNAFDYAIEADPAIDQDLVYIPSMILQPYVENGVRHGMRYKTDGKGMIRVQFRQTGEDLLCIVEDNGIGREGVHKLKSTMHVEYQSKGMSLTAARIDALNRQHHELVTIEILDLTGADGKPAGTRIVIYFPVKMLIKIS
jgi:ligand-binding sensor domain-containing protein